MHTSYIFISSGSQILRFRLCGSHAYGSSRSVCQLMIRNRTASTIRYLQPHNSPEQFANRLLEIVLLEYEFRYDMLTCRLRASKLCANSRQFKKKKQFSFPEFAWRMNILSWMRTTCRHCCCYPLLIEWRERNSKKENFDYVCFGWIVTVSRVKNPNGIFICQHACSWFWWDATWQKCWTTIETIKRLKNSDEIAAPKSSKKKSVFGWCIKKEKTT